MRNKLIAGFVTLVFVIAIAQSVFAAHKSSVDDIKERMYKKANKTHNESINKTMLKNITNYGQTVKAQNMIKRDEHKEGMALKKTAGKDWWQAWKDRWKTKFQGQHTGSNKWTKNVTVNVTTPVNVTTNVSVNTTGNTTV